MNNAIPNFDRQPNESEYVWQSRVKQYIRKNAPKEHRYYVRDGRPGAKGQRWFIPGLFVAIGLFFSVSGYMMGDDIRNLNGPNGRQGEFTVIDLEHRYRDTKNAEGLYDVPVVMIRDTQVIPLLSKDRQFELGEPITVKYTEQGKVVAAFANEDGHVSDGSSMVLTIIGILVIGIGILVGRFYKGAVDYKYVESEFARLTNQPTNTDVL
jgi:hypothetical protein